MARSSALTICGSVVALAFLCPPANSEPLQSHRFRPDAGVARDRAAYEKLHIAERYGITFHPYASLCGHPAHKTITCLAKIVIDEVGMPLTFGSVRGEPPGYSPKELRAAYGMSGVANGQPIIGIVDAYGNPNAIDDLKEYSKHFKLPVLPKCNGSIASSAVPCIEVVNQKGKTKNYPIYDPSWAGEQSLDLDMAHAMCENCSILLVETDTNGLGDALAGVQTAARLKVNAISNSWGTPESSGETGLDSSFLNYPGIVITASTGDHGYAGGVVWPASSPNAVAVGGTTLLLSTNGKKYASEVAWSGAGSGCSAFEPRPSWQPSMSGCANNRTISDISVDADPNTGVAVYDSNECDAGKGNCWTELGGTSMSAPIVAAMYMLAGNIGTTNQAASILYQNVSKKNSRDITGGSNGTCEFAYICNAVVGYDGPTGLGSPKSTNIFVPQ